MMMGVIKGIIEADLAEALNLLMEESPVFSQTCSSLKRGMFSCPMSLMRTGGR